MYAELKQIVCKDCGEIKSTRYYKTAERCQDCSKKLWMKNKAKKRAAKRKLNPDFHKNADFKNDLMKNYGMTLQDYEDMYQKQDGKCACCDKHASEFKRRLHVDHDHNTGQIRALLCTKCNPGLGYFEDSVEKLEMAIKYLNKFKIVG